MTRIPTIHKTDLDSITPKRLRGHVDYSVYDQFVDFAHRGRRCQVDQLLSYLGAAIDHAAIAYGKESRPSTLSELDVVDIIIEALASRYPAWFGQPDALAALNKATSDFHLSESDLREAYWQDQLSPGEPVKGDNWTDQKRVIIPLLALALQTVRKQKQTDSNAATKIGQNRIKKAVMREAYQNDLSDYEVRQAVHDGLEALPSR